MKIVNYRATRYKVLLDYIDQAAKDNWQNLVLMGTARSSYNIKFKDTDFIHHIIINETILRDKKLPSEIGKLKYLRKLAIHFLDMETLPDEIGMLISLEETSFRYNHLSELPNSCSNLKKLRSIDISINNFSTFPSAICNMTNLESINIGNNSIKSLPPRIGRLVKLRELVLTDNKLKTFPDSIGSLRKLEVISAGENDIASLPPSMKDLKSLKLLILDNSPLVIPPEILARSDEPQDILTYYFTIASETKKPLNEIKLLALGQGSVGKTSLVQRILHGTFDQNQTKTEGISINRWQVGGIGKVAIGNRGKTDSQVMSSKSQITNPESAIKFNIWDFGGQEIMHATHQFFLTKRSLYLLVLDARLTQEENRVEYWLKIIQSFGGESPILIVGNKTDQHPLDIDRTGLQKKYPNIAGILETSAATGAGIEALKAEIAKHVDTMPHVHDLVPETWFTVKSKLEEFGKDKNFITQDEYFSLCTQNNVTDEASQHTLIGFLHDLGIVLHFQDDPRLEALGILNPQWVTNGVYKILNSHELFQNKGTLTLPMLNRILDLPQYPNLTKRLYIVDMMKKFELCYDIESDKSFLVPDLLPKDEIYTGSWDDALAFQYHYSVLPSSIITRFIVRMNAFIHKNTIWRSGVVLKYDDNTALVKADTEDQKIYIWVSGKEDTCRDLLAMIRGEFEAIHKTIAKIEVTEKVPVPNVPEASPVDLAFLQRLANEGRESLPVQAGDQIIDLIVKEVLSRIEIDAKRNININIGGDVGGNFIVGDDNTANRPMAKKKQNP